jgi:coenzyme F420-0:L-glutamate ligase/coenzyme F420-1:gamma-L-glutamate ligase
MTADPVLTPSQREFLAAARRAVLATIAPDGRPRLVPICFVLDEGRPVLYSPLDEKPKAVVDSRRLARVRDLLADPRVTVLVDRWDEDWTRLAWLRCHGTATLLEPSAGVEGEHARMIAALRAKYPPYEAHRLEIRPLIRIEIEQTTTWTASEPESG